MSPIARCVRRLTAAVAVGAAIDRQALVSRHNPVIRQVDAGARLTVGNGGFAFTVDITSRQSLGKNYYRHGIPLETLARWCWVTDETLHRYMLADTNEDYRLGDGRAQGIPMRLRRTGCAATRGSSRPAGGRWNG